LPSVMSKTKKVKPLTPKDENPSRWIENNIADIDPEKLQRHYVMQAVEHGGGNIMVLGCFTWWHVEHILLIYMCGVFQKCAYPETYITLQTRITNVKRIGL